MYFLLKFAHIFSVVIFLGNITTGLFWHAQAARSKDPTILAHVMNGIIRSDQWFTVPGVIGILATGVMMSMKAGFPILGTRWIAWSLILFGVSGLLFMFRLAPLQRQLRDLAAAGAQSGDFDFGVYRVLAIRWEIWGAVALLAPFGALALMVLKPSL